MLITLGRGITPYGSTKNTAPPAPFTPLTLSPALWLDASDTSTITETAGLVSQWDDKSGHINHATQSTGSYQPITGARTVNGLNAIDLDGTSDHFILPSSLYSIPAANNTVFIAYQSDSLTRDQRILTGELSSGSRWYIRHDANSSKFSVGNSNPYSGAARASIAKDAAQHSGLLYRNGTEIYGYYDDTKTATGTANDVTLDGLYLGSGPGGASLHFDGLLCEIIMFNKALSNAELNQVGNYLSTKWGTAWTDI